jgi:hypothetical protein
MRPADITSLDKQSYQEIVMLHNWRSFGLVLALVVLISLSACTAASAVPQAAAQEAAPATSGVGADVRPVGAGQSTLGAAPTRTPSPAGGPFNTIDDIFAFNNVAAKESGGIRLEIARVVIGRKEVLERDGSNFSGAGRFRDVDVVGEIIFKVTNTSDKKVSFFLDQGTIVINGERIDVKLGDDIESSFLPGAKVIGGIRFAVMRSKVREVNILVFRVKSPVDENQTALADDFELTIDLSRREYQPRIIKVN